MYFAGSEAADLLSSGKRNGIGIVSEGRDVTVLFEKLVFVLFKSKFQVKPRPWGSDKTFTNGLSIFYLPPQKKKKV